MKKLILKIDKSSIKMFVNSYKYFFSKFKFSTNKNEAIINIDKNSNLNIKENKENKNVKEVKSDKSLEELKKEAVEDYKIFEDSTVESINKLKKYGINLENHLNLKNEVKEIINNDKQQEYYEKTGIVVLERKNTFTLSNLDPHNYLVKYRDKNYKVDIKEVLTRDLYEKQRVVDNFVEENKEKANFMLNSHENRFKVFSNKNTFLYLVYKNPYSQNLIYNFEVKVRIGIASDLHDNIGATLSSIHIYTDSVQKNIEKGNMNIALKILNQIGNDCRESIDNMSDIVWAINPKNESLNRMTMRMKSFTNNMLGAKGIKSSFDIDQSIENQEWEMIKR